jgi:DNA-directed RNA polymerase subunit E'/Rpb7
MIIINNKYIMNVDISKYESLITKRVILKPEQLMNIDESIFKNLVQRFGNTYIEVGYVYAETIKVLQRTMLAIVPNKFTADVYTDVKFSATVKNPIRGNLIKGRISGINKAGFLIIDHPFYINVLIEQHENKLLFKDLKRDDEVAVVILATKHDPSKKIVMINAVFEEEYKNIQKKREKKPAVSVDQTGGEEDVLETMNRNNVQDSDEEEGGEGEEETDENVSIEIENKNNDNKEEDDENKEEVDEEEETEIDEDEDDADELETDEEDKEDDEDEDEEEEEDDEDEPSPPPKNKTTVGGKGKSIGKGKGKGRGRGKGKTTRDDSGADESE